MDYHHIKVTITDYLFRKETIDFFEPQPKKRALNTLLNMDKKGCAKMYKLLKGSNTHILDNIVSTWNKNTGRNICNHDLSTSFNLHQATYKDTYLKYIQFCTLHTNASILRKNFIKWVLKLLPYVHSVTQKMTV